MATRNTNAAKNENEATDDGPETWRFDTKGAKLTARLDKVRTATLPNGANGEPYSYPLLWVTEASGKQWLVHAYPQTLVEELHNVKPNIGDTFTIEYQGERKTKSQRTAKIFEVTLGDGIVQEFDWDNAPF